MGRRGGEIQPRQWLMALLGGLCYYGLETTFRGYSHWTMTILGGLCFALIGGMNEYFPRDMALLEQGIAGGCLITGVELAAGLVLNRFLGLWIWDYSRMPFNLWGQICLPFSLLWVAVAMGAVVLDDWLRWVLFGEKMPRYHLL